MSMRQQVMAGVLAVAMIATLGATAVRNPAASSGKQEPSMWLDPNVPDQLLASRLNLTNIAKTPPSE